jgi:hypothetical protein
MLNGLFQKEIGLGARPTSGYRTMMPLAGHFYQIITLLHKLE